VELPPAFVQEAEIRKRELYEKLKMEYLSWNE
jgi:hypothetical protein